MANTIADKLARLEQTKQELYDALMQKGAALPPDAAFSAYPSILRSLKVIRSQDAIYGRNLFLSVQNGSGGLDVSGVSISGSNIIVALNGSGGYGTPDGYSGSVNVSGEIVIPFL